MKRYITSLAVIIPCFNEAKRIGATLRAVNAYVQNCARNWEIIIVNDGSSDDTVGVVRRWARTNHTRHIKILSLPRNIGKGGAIKKGVISTKKQWILIMDADSATPISEVRRLWSGKGDAEVIYGSRYLDQSLLQIKQPLPRRILGRAGNLLARVVLRIKLVDTQCGFKLISQKAARQIFSKTQTQRWGWDLEVLAIATNYKIKIREVAVVWRHIGGSTFRAGRGMWQTLIELFAIRRNLKKGQY